MLEVNKSDNKHIIKTDDTMILVLLEEAIKEHIQDLQWMLNKEIHQHRHEQYRKSIEKYREYLKQI